MYTNAIFGTIYHILHILVHVMRVTIFMHSALRRTTYRLDICLVFWCKYIETFIDDFQKYFVLLENMYTVIT